MKPLVSVIIPVYRVEKYLTRCLNSLCNQSLKNIEFLVIDDASPDRCGEICEQYAAKDLRFKVIHHITNKGLSAARNTGIQFATANYLMFVDSDDWVHEDFCKSAYECANLNHSDIVIFGYKHIVDKSVQHKQKNKTFTVTDGFITPKDAINLTFTAFGMAAWNKIYRRNLFEDICYPEGHLFEDSATSYKLLWKANRVFCLSKVLYYYFRHSESITMSQPTTYMVRERLRIYLQQCIDLSTWGFRSKQFELFKSRTALLYCIKMPNNHSDSYYIFSTKVIRSIKKLPQEFTLKQIILVKLFQLSPFFFNFICNISNKRMH